MGLPTLLIMSALLGAGSFAAGSLPLSFVFSKSHLSKLSALGTGLLLGAALGVIIPEGIETLSSSQETLPTSKIALCLLSGFTFMLILEQLVSPHSHSSSPSSGAGAYRHPRDALPMHTRPSLTLSTPTTIDFDADLDEIEGEFQPHKHNGNSAVNVPTISTTEPSRSNAFPLTLGLVMHALADGLALGVSSLTSSESAKDGSAQNPLSLVVFIALFIHKAPTALALTTSLLSTSLSRSQCRKHLLIFSLSTPIGALVTYFLFSALGNGKDGSRMDELAGLALLVSGGTFLYVATVLQPVSSSEHDHNSNSNSGGYSIDDPVLEDDSNSSSGNKTRVLLVVIGMFVPFLIGSLFGHGHDHGHHEHAHSDGR